MSVMSERWALGRLEASILPVSLLVSNVPLMNINVNNVRKVGPEPGGRPLSFFSRFTVGRAFLPVSRYHFLREIAVFAETLKRH